MSPDPYTSERTSDRPSDRFWLSVVASTALAVGFCVVIGRLAPHLMGIPDGKPRVQPRSLQKVLVIDANNAMVRVSELPQANGDAKAARRLVDKALKDLADAGAVVIDRRAVLAAPEGTVVDTGAFVDRIARSAPMVGKPVPKLDVKRAESHDAERPAVRLDMTPEELADLAKPPQNEEDLKKTLDALNQFADLLEQIQKAQQGAGAGK